VVLYARQFQSMIGLMEVTTKKMINRWTGLVFSGQIEINIEADITDNAAEIIAKASFGINEEKCKTIYEKLRSMQVMLFKSNRLVGVPFSKLLLIRQSYSEWKLGKEIDALLLEVIESRRQQRCDQNAERQQTDLLALMMAENDDKATQEKRLTTKELIDECKTFFFGGHETTALALSWSLLMLALHPEWQSTLREEFVEATQNGELTSDVLSRLTKVCSIFLITQQKMLAFNT
jgi:cytochrome P450